MFREQLSSFHELYPSSGETVILRHCSEIPFIFEMQVEMCLCGLYHLQTINTFYTAIGTVLAASGKAASKMNGRGSGQCVSMQVVMVVIREAVHSGWWNVSSLCEI